jgi:glycosyltransferase involved in cell wall biosynthesis
MLTHIHSLIKERRPAKGIFHCPPVLHQHDCPPISIITPTYNRQKLIDIAFHNLLVTDYPKDKIEWIVIEDNEKTPHMAAEKIISFQIQVPDIKIKYMPIEGRMSIGEKRNHAIENASNDIILFMDDDDHYPETSFRRRVAWLTKGTKCGQVGADIACCTTIALYDLKRGISAVNVPPYDIPFAQRISEATLTFKKSAWLERKFTNVSLAEGEDWISGRENQVIEIPPQQIIVAFSHGNNQSSRRIPPTDQKPACFWGFPKEYLIFIHGLVDVEIEDDKKTQSKR